MRYAVSRALPSVSSARVGRGCGRRLGMGSGFVFARRLCHPLFVSFVRSFHRIRGSCLYSILRIRQLSFRDELSVHRVPLHLVLGYLPVWPLPLGHLPMWPLLALVRAPLT